MGKRPEEPVLEAGVVLHVVAPGHVARAENGIAEPLLVDGKGCRHEGRQHVAGNVVGGRGHEHAEIGVEEVDGHGLGAGEA